MSKSFLVHEFNVNSIEGSIELDTFINVIKRKEDILYRSSVPVNAANIAFLSGAAVSSSNNISIADRSTSLVSNRVRDYDPTILSDINTFSTTTEDIIITDEFTTETETVTEIPLFYKHILNLDRDDDGDLESTTTLLDIKVLDYMLNVIDVSELKIDYSKGIIYNNLSSYYENEDDYEIYYIKYIVNENGVTSTKIDLLNNITTYSLASYDDLTYGLELIDDGRKVYLIEEDIDVFNITLPTIGTYAYKITTSKLEVVNAVSSDISEPWFVRINTGKFLTYTNEGLRKYHIAEYLTQSFNPEPPIKRIASEISAIVNKTIIKLDHQYIYEDDDLELYVNIQISKSDGTAVAAFTTDSSIVGDIADNGETWSQWSNSTRYGIKSIDHKTGYVDIEGLQLKSSWRITSSYYYEEKYYEFTLINFNPISNQDIIDRKVVLFIDPDTQFTTKTQTLYYLIVDKTGKVTESNWSSFDNDLQTISSQSLYYEAFPSWKPSESYVIFTDTYSVEGLGSFLILADITVSPFIKPSELEIYDSRNRGGGIIDSSISDVKMLTDEARLVWDELFYDGIPYPGNASYLVEMPVELLDGAGGNFTQQEIKDIVNRHTAAGVYPICKAYGVDITISGIDIRSDYINISWNSPSVGYGDSIDIYYNIYSSLSQDGPWTLVNEDPLEQSENGNNYLVSGLNENTLYYINIIGGYLEDDIFIPLIGQNIGPKTYGINGINGSSSKFLCKTFDVG